MGKKCFCELQCEQLQFFLDVSFLFYAGYVLVMSSSSQDVTPSSSNLDWTIFSAQYKIFSNFSNSFSQHLFQTLCTPFPLAVRQTPSECVCGSPDLLK